MTIDVLVNGTAVPIDEAVFRTLLDNSVAGTYKGYERALELGRIRFVDLIDLCRKGDIPYPLSFAPLPMVEAQVAAKVRSCSPASPRTRSQSGPARAWSSET